MNPTTIDDSPKWIIADIQRYMLSFCVIMWFDNDQKMCDISRKVLVVWIDFILFKSIYNGLLSMVFIIKTDSHTHTPHSTIDARINWFLPFICFFVLKQWASIIVTVTFKILLFKLKTYRREKNPKRSENRFAWDETKIGHCIFFIRCLCYLFIFFFYFWTTILLDEIFLKIIKTIKTNNNL